ncbi:MAG: glycosyltransferase family A protein [Terracidiphilus sp.]|jgi:glycosyltransferase involved in cell wall biosynthesis
MRISVIIPAYNAERYIAEAIESCLSQTYAPHEIIVVDDRSSDRTAEIAESFAPRVRVIRLAENVGVATARNQGIQASTGDWLAFLDADDYFLPEKLELQRRCAQQNARAVLIYTGFRIIAVDGSESGGQFIPPGELLPMLRYRNRMNASSVIMRRDAFDSVEGFDPSLRIAQDWDMWLRVAARFSVELFAAVPEPLVVYRRVAGSLSSSAMRYFYQRQPIIQTSCLFATAGISRFLLRRRVSAYNYYDTSESLRDEGSLSYLPYMLMSFVHWPFSSIAMQNRYKVAIVMTLQTCAHLRKAFMKAK